MDTNVTLAEFIDEYKNWNLAKLAVVLPTILVQNIRGIPIPLLDSSDSPIWECTNLGEFSVKSATWLAHDLPFTEEKWKYRWIGSLILLPNSKSFCGKSVTRESQQRKSSLIGRLCPLAVVRDVIFIVSRLTIASSPVSTLGMSGHITI